MLAILAFLLALTGGAFASPFHGHGLAADGNRGFGGPVQFDGGTGLPDHGGLMPPPPPISGGAKIGAPGRMDGGTGVPDRP
jgi:hypothetical protein